MISSSAILQEEYLDEYVIQETRFLSRVAVDEAVIFTELELSIRDSETGRALSKAMISLDTIGRTAVCDDLGKVLICEILSGTYPIDIIVPGYIACSTQVQLSGQKLNMLTIKMTRNC